MRIPYSALIALLVASAVPSVGLAQVLTPLNPPRHDCCLDHVVPVATYSRVGDIVVLGGARIVQDPSGVPFVLGAATLNLRDPAHAQIVFTMTNASEMPIALNDVEIAVHTIASAKPDNGRPPHWVGNMSAARAGHHGGGPLQPGATVTVQVPISDPHCRNDKCEARGFLVFVGRPSPHPDLWTTGPSDPAWREVGKDKPKLNGVFETLISQTQQ